MLNYTDEGLDPKTDGRYEKMLGAILATRTPDFFDENNLPSPGLCNEQQYKDLINFLNPNGTRKCNQKRVKIYMETRRRFLYKEVLLIRTKAKTKGKFLLGQPGYVIGIVGAVTTAISFTTTPIGGSTCQSSHYAHRPRYQMCKDLILKVRVKLDSGSIVVLSSDEVRDKTLF